jgi:MerR family redox-sensitive transcriptional activator SoxR
VLERLAVLDVAKQAGFSLNDIRRRFEATDRGAPAHQRMKELAVRKLPEVEALIEHAHEVKRWLQAVDECTCDTLGECALFEGGLPDRASGD